MENRLKLNKKPKYELPDNTRVMLYKNQEGYKSHPNFEPDICLKLWGNSIKIEEKYKSNCQIWIKTDNKDLINFIKEYKIVKRAISAQSINVYHIKKIILEEFYNEKV